MPLFGHFLVIFRYGYIMVSAGMPIPIANKVSICLKLSNKSEAASLMQVTVPVLCWQPIIKNRPEGRFFMWLQLRVTGRWRL
ncbi:hypothetical protein PSEUDO9AZ_40632 [Pseudomonas sp. 9AZ]|jgi:hypothetical protein|nr:hypothetical protein PSEUDO9AZ_40632 [Pseudomonas sp. 9AZ]